MIPKRVRRAVLLSFLFHGLLVLATRYRTSFDAYTHMFFADHYRLDWWSLWEPRWYTGFEINSYPPLVHQAIGLLSHLLGVEAAFALVFLTVLTAFPLGVYAFSRIFTGPATAGYAALGSAFLPSIYLSAHTFGQLPTLAGTLLALFAGAAFARYLRTGERLSGALAVALIAVVMASHHGTLLFLPWLLLAIVLHLRISQNMEWRSLIIRVSLFTVFATLVALVVVWPFWGWGLGQELQTPIDHPSRHNFLTDPFAIITFFLPMYGPLMVLIPFALWFIGLRHRRGLGIAFLGLFLFGLGGTTALPRWVFGAGWEWLTYDRFALWASIFLLPYLGMLLIPLRRFLPRLLSLTINLVSSPIRQTRLERLFEYPNIRIRQVASMVAFGLLGLTSLITGTAQTIFHVQPPQVDMQPIVKYLEEEGRWQWRYLTFGFGNQLAYLSRLTTATTIDGSYHTARNLPELRKSGIAQIDTAFWTPVGVGALDPILERAQEHGVRWGFVHRSEYIPVLVRNGWSRITILKNGVQVWQNSNRSLPQPAQPVSSNQLAEFLWGVLPLLALALTAGLAGLQFRPLATRRILLKIHTFAIALLPLGLTFWYFRTLAELGTDRIYFTYDHALFFLSDALALIAVLAWALQRFFLPRQTDSRSSGGLAGILQSPGIWLIGLGLLASLSMLWSLDRQVSLYVGLHLWLAIALFFSLFDRPQVWRAVAYGFCAALGLQIVIGFWQFGVQSTDFLNPLELIWPKATNPEVIGAIIVEALGVRFLRVYGTLPHPNLLGGWIVVYLIGPFWLFLRNKNVSGWFAVLFSLGLMLLVLTFSRGAWIGLAVAGLVILLKRRLLDRKRLILLSLAGIIGLVAILSLTRPLIVTRLGATSAPTEAYSVITRLALIDYAVEIIQEQPWLGVGAGGFMLALERITAPGLPIEPVHNLALLVISDLGLGGALMLIGLAIVILIGIRHARTPAGVISSAALAGLLATSLFDHYLWTLAPGRLLLGLMLGLWAAQVRQKIE